jgi:hypothetical protein
MERIPKTEHSWINKRTILTRINIDRQSWDKKNSLNIFLLLPIEWDNRIEKRIQKGYNEDDNLALKATPKYHSHFLLDNSLVTIYVFKTIFPLYQLRAI